MEEAEKQQKKEREEATRVEIPQEEASPMEKGVAKKRTSTERSETEMDTEGGGETSTFTECQSRRKKGHMTKIYLTDSDDEAIVDFVKDYE